MRLSTAYIFEAREPIYLIGIICSIINCPTLGFGIDVFKYQTEYLVVF